MPGGIVWLVHASLRFNALIGAVLPLFRDIGIRQVTRDFELKFYLGDKFHQCGDDCPHHRQTPILPLLVPRPAGDRLDSNAGQKEKEMLCKGEDDV